MKKKELLIFIATFLIFMFLHLRCNIRENVNKLNKLEKQLIKIENILNSKRINYAEK